MHGYPIIGRFIPAAQAHEKWFLDPASAMSSQPPFYLSWNAWTVSAVAFIAVAVIGGAIADRWFERSALHRKLEGAVRPFRDMAALALSASTGLLLLWSAATNTLFADNFILPDSSAGAVLRIAQLAFGVSLMVGLYMPLCAVGLFVLYGTAFLLFPFPEPLDYVYLPAIALFLLAFARGRYSLDWFLGKGIASTADERKRAYLVLRLVMGAGLLLLAAEKWSAPGLHLELMRRYANWNPYVLLTLFGRAVWLSPEQYVFGLFVAEMISGLFVLFGFLMRITAAFLIFLFLASMAFLGPFELFGHLPIIGTLFVLFVFGDRYHKSERAAATAIKKAA